MLHSTSSIFWCKEESTIVIQMMGNWNPSIVQSTSYFLTKLPMEPIHKLVVFLDGNDINFNLKMKVEVEESLLQLTPVGGWLCLMRMRIYGGG
jgi:hypothetical protein